MYLHNGDYQPTTTFYDCESNKDWVYVAQLNENQSLMHEKPFLVHRGNGVILGLDHTFDQVHLMQEGNRIKSIQLTFITSCEENESLIINEKPTNHSPDGSLMMISLVLLLMIVALGMALGVHLKRNRRQY